MMNEYHTIMYQDLMDLCQASKVRGDNCFYFVDQIRLTKVFRIFMYRLAQFTDFKQPHALSCRGMMYELDRDTMLPIRIAAYPMDKFFNLNENPMTQDLDVSNPVAIYTKEDGSLISSYHIDGELFLKSKGSLWSDQAVAAEAWLNEDPALKAEIADLTRENCTVNFEWCGPTNRIVLPYRDHSLRVIDMRENDSGFTLHPHMLNNASIREKYPNLLNRLIEDHKHRISNAREFIESIPNMEGIEGYVILLTNGQNGQRVKIKTNWYLTRHRLKDSVNNPKHLLEAIVTEAVDDIKTMFAGDEITLELIANMEAKVMPRFNTMITTVEDFYHANKTLERKEYAIKAQALNDGYMSLYMNMYLTRPNNYQEFAVKYAERFI